MFTLPFDGTHLGDEKFNEVISKWYPTSLEVNHKIPVLCGFYKDNPIYLKRITSKRHDQVFLDEVKQLFGLEKMGTHVVTLDRSYRRDDPFIVDGRPKLVFENKRTHYLLIKGDVSEGKFLRYLNIEKLAWLPSNPKDILDKHRLFFFELQKIFLFKELFRVTQVSIKDVVIRHNPDTPEFKAVPLSIDEMHIREPDKQYKITASAEDVFLSRRYIREQLLIEIFGLTEENYLNHLDKLRRELWNLVKKHAPGLDFIPEYIYEKIRLLMESYFEDGY